MNLDKKIGRFCFEIKSHNIDFTGKVNMKSLTELLLICAADSATQNGFSIEYLNDRGMTWVLARLLIQMKELPKQNDTIYIESWIASIEDKTSERKFAIFDHNNNLIGVASSMWAVIDINTRKVTELSQIDILNNCVVEREYQIEDSERVRCNDGDFVMEHEVKYSDLDINKHVNSAKYVEWILNAIHIDRMTEKPIFGMLINYQYEVFYGEVVKVRESSKRTLHFDIFKSDNSNATKCKFWDEPFNL